MVTSRRSFLSGAAGVGALSLVPGGLLAAVEKATPPLPRLDDWRTVREQFALAPEWTHLAGFFIASHPAPVRDAIEGYRRAIDANPYLAVEQAIFESEGQNLLGAARVEIASYLGGKPDEIAVTQNTTTGLALVYHGLVLKAGDEVLTTTHDHNVHHESIRLAAERSGASTRKVTLFDAAPSATADSIITRLHAEIRPSTRVVGITWVHSQTGIRLPIRGIATMVAETNRSRAPGERIRLVVDGVHGLGCVDESVADMGADYFIAGTHKWMFAPRGTGIVWATAERWAELRQLLPTFSDHEPFKAWTEGRPIQTPNNARRMTPGGFQAFEHQWAMAAAFRMHRTLGRPRVAARVAELNTQIKEGLAAIATVKLHTPRDPALSAGICCFEVAGQKPDQVVQSLLARKIIASTSPYAVRYARLSAGIYNTPQDVERALAAVRLASA